jgi:5-methylcytosine-specific restriction endonuclease McrA
MSQDILPDAKACNCCGVVKPLSDYRRKSRNKDGRFPKCKACMKERESSEEYKQRNRARANEWYRANPEVVRKRSREWAKANPERSRASKRKHQALASARERLLQWRQENPGALRGYRRRYYLGNRDRYLQYARTRRAKVVGASGYHTKDDVAIIAAVQGMRCAYCRKKLKAFHVDHILPLALFGSNDKSNLQILCPTCNWKKGAKHPIDYANKIGLLL